MSKGGRIVDFCAIIIDMGKNKKKLIIIDGNALIHRSFHALPPTIKTGSGELVNAVFGFATGLIKAINDLKPDYLVVAFDRKGPTIRHEKYKEYKATRTKAPDELYKQIPKVKEIVKAFNIPIYEIERYEADDLIGTICAKVGDDLEKVVVTGDMDILQLIDDSTKVYRMSRGVSDYKLFGGSEVFDKYGIKPEQVVDYKALRGDASDNIPGVAGIGDKTTVSLLQEFKTLEGVYKNIDSEKIKPRVKSLLLEHRDEAFLSYELAKIIRDIPIDFDLEKSLFSDYKKEEVIKLFSDFEFKSLLPRLRKLSGAENEDGDNEAFDKFERNNRKYKYHLIGKEKDFKNFLTQIKKQKAFAYDVETGGIDPLLDNLLGISFSWEEGEAYYLNLNNKNQDERVEACDNLFNYQKSNEGDREKPAHPWLEKLKPVFCDEKIKKYAHNMKFDMRFVEAAIGEEVRGVDFDTMIAAYLLNPGTRQNNLDAVSFQELGIEKISKEDLLGSGRDKKTFSELSAERLANYSCEDADCTFRLVAKLRKHLKEKDLQKLNKEIEVPLITTLARMENNGIMIDKEFLARMSKKLNGKIKKQEKKIFELAGCEFNIKSTKQLKEVLFEKLEINIAGIKKTKTGYSTAFSELEKIKNAHPIIEHIQEYRELTKLTSTYIDALPELVNPKTKRVHTSFNQTITATGRLSSTNPNLQNIPVRRSIGREIRKAFVVPKGYKLLALDYSQIELRIAAHLSKDKEMIKAFSEGRDIHAATAAKVNHIGIKEVDKKMRSEAKAVNFGILYGQGPHGLSMATGMSFAEAKDFILKYFENFQEVKKYLDSRIELAKKQGFVETLFGRKRYLPDINSKLPMLKKASERMAVNTPIQGTAADIIKIAMNKISALLKKLQKDKKNIKMLIQVHDELLFEVREDLSEKFAKIFKKEMEEVAKLKVPLIADVKIGDNWGELEELIINNEK